MTPTQYLPTSIAKLEALLADETDPARRAAIKARMNYVTRRRGRRAAEHQGRDFIVLPAEVGKLEALRATVDNPRLMARIDKRIDERRARNRYRTAAQREQRAARSPEEVARVQAEAFPDGRQTCRDCGKRLPLSAFEDNPSRRTGKWQFCQPCRTTFATHQQEDANV